MGDEIGDAEEWVGPCPGEDGIPGKGGSFGEVLNERSLYRFHGGCGEQKQRGVLYASTRDVICSLGPAMTAFIRKRKLTHTRPCLSSDSSLRDFEDGLSTATRR